MNKEYVNIYINTSYIYHDLIYAILYDYSFTGIEEQGDRLIVSFNAEDWDKVTREDLIVKLKNVSDDIYIDKEEIIGEKNWNAEWEIQVEPVVISGKIGITPEWKKEQINPEIKIIINPKMSFGTGHHASTRLACKLMENAVKPGTFWIDAGAGTGILAILAIRLGADRVFAFDNNSWAFDNAVENFKLNGVDDKVELLEIDLFNAEIPSADAIAANMNTNIIVKAMNVFNKSLREKKGKLIVSGIMADDYDDIMRAANENDFALIRTETEDEWIAFHFTFSG